LRSAADRIRQRGWRRADDRYRARCSSPRAGAEDELGGGEQREAQDERRAAEGGRGEAGTSGGWAALGALVRRVVELAVDGSVLVFLATAAGGGETLLALARAATAAAAARGAFGCAAQLCLVLAVRSSMLLAKARATLP